MDDDTKQSAAQEAQAAREEGAQAQYDTQDEDALKEGTTASESNSGQTTLEKEQHS